jgi:arsenical-resistance protein 2
LQDYVDEVGGDLGSQVMIGGIRGWVKVYGGGMMDGYDEQRWRAEDR